MISAILSIAWEIQLFH